MNPTRNAVLACRLPEGNPMPAGGIACFAYAETGSVASQAESGMASLLVRPGCPKSDHVVRSRTSWGKGEERWRKMICRADWVMH
jgi:hypothetical protein